MSDLSLYPATKFAIIELSGTCYATKIAITPTTTIDEITLTATYSFKIADRELFGSGWELACFADLEYSTLIFPSPDDSADELFSKISPGAGIWYFWLGSQEILVAADKLVLSSISSLQFVPEVRNCCYEQSSLGPRRLVNIHLDIDPSLLIKSSVTPTTTFQEIFDLAKSKCSLLRPYSDIDQWVLTCKRSLSDLDLIIPNPHLSAWSRSTVHAPDKLDVWISRTPLLRLCCLDHQVIPSLCPLKQCSDLSPTLVTDPREGFAERLSITSAEQPSISGIQDSFTTSLCSVLGTIG